MTEETRKSPELEALPEGIAKRVRDLEAMLAGLDEEKLGDSTAVLEMIAQGEDLADEFRDLRFRGAVGKTTGLLPAIAAAQLAIVGFCRKLERIYLLVSLLRQLLRIVGNLVHTADRNRRLYVDANGALALTKSLDLLFDIQRRGLSSTEDEIQIALLVATNLSVNFQPAVEAMAKAGLSATLAAVVNYAYSKKWDWMSLPLLTLEELVDVEEGWKQIPESLPCTVVQMLLHYAMKMDPAEEERTEGAMVLCSAVLESIVEHAGPGRYTSWMCEECDRPVHGFTDDPQTVVWVKLLSFLRGARPDHPPLLHLAPGDPIPSPYSLIKAHIIRALVLAVAYADFAPHAAHLMMFTLVDWLNDPLVINGRVDLIIMIGLWLGNLACDKTSCRVLIEECEILDPIVKIFKKWTPSQLGDGGGDGPSDKPRPGEQAQVLHAWCGLTRNLAVADTYKGKLGEIGMVAYAVECFRREFDIVEPLSGTAAALLRHLCRNHEENVGRLVAGGMVGGVVDLARRAEQPFLVLEASRLLAGVVSAATRLDPASHAHHLRTLYSDAAVDALVRFAYVAAGAHQLLLINEALVALALLAVRPDLAHALCRNLVMARDQVGTCSGPADAEERGKKTSYGSALEALMAIWKPAAEPVAAEEAEEKQSPDEDDDEEEVGGLLAQLALEPEAKAEMPEQLAQAKKPTPPTQTPVQMQENLVVVFVQLGRQVAGDVSLEVQQVRTGLLDALASVQSSAVSFDEVLEAWNSAV